jgi:hypothetical protein
MYMIFQQYTSAIKEAYSGQPEISQHVESARKFRRWLESLNIDDGLRNSLVEPIQVLEEAFTDLAAQST